MSMNIKPLNKKTQTKPKHKAEIRCRFSFLFIRFVKLDLFFSVCLLAVHGGADFFPICRFVYSSSSLIGMPPTSRPREWEKLLAIR